MATISCFDRLWLLTVKVTSIKFKSYELIFQNQKDSDYGYKLKEGIFRLNIRRNLFTVRVVRHYNRSPREVVDLPTQSVFKTTLDEALSNLVGGIPAYSRVDWV